MDESEKSEENMELEDLSGLPSATPLTQTKIGLCHIQHLVNIVYCRAVCGKSASTVHLGVSIER